MLDVRGENGAEKLQMKRNYTGFLIGPLLNLLKRNKLATQPRAVQLTNTVNEMMKSGEYKFVRNTYDKLMEIADKFNADDNGVIEVDFFKSENKPVLFHMSNCDLTDFDGTDWITTENHWKDGEGHLDEKYGGSEITHSEVRHADKIINEFGQDANIWQVQGT